MQQSESVQPTAKRRIGLIVAASLAAGLVLAVALVAIPLIPATENVLTGAILLAWALGWALLAVLSVRFSDQPQRWAAAPATFMALVGLGILAGSAGVHRVLSWVWPPALFVLVTWMFLRVRRRCRAAAPAGCCTPYWRCCWWPRWAAAMRRSASRSTRGPIPCPDS